MALDEWEKVEYVARSLCIADSYDPEMKVMRFPNPRIGPKGRVVIIDADVVPAWTLFVEGAQNAIKAIEALPKNSAA